MRTQAATAATTVPAASQRCWFALSLSVIFSLVEILKQFGAVSVLALFEARECVSALSIWFALWRFSGRVCLCLCEGIDKFRRDSFQKTVQRQVKTRRLRTTGVCVNVCQLVLCVVSLVYADTSECSPSFGRPRPLKKEACQPTDQPDGDDDDTDDGNDVAICGSRRLGGCFRGVNVNSAIFALCQRNGDANDASNG